MNRLRQILKNLSSGEVKSEVLIKNLEYTASVLEKVYTEETRLVTLNLFYFILYLYISYVKLSAISLLTAAARICVHGVTLSGHASMVSPCQAMRPWCHPVRPGFHGVTLSGHASMVSPCQAMLPWCHPVRPCLHGVTLSGHASMVSPCQAMRPWCHPVRPCVHGVTLHSV